MKVSVFFGLLSFFLGFLALTGCATSSTDLLRQRQEQNHARAAGYAADGFILDSRMPEPQPRRSWEFYYKNCVLVGRSPYPDRNEYSCNDPF